MEHSASLRTIIAGRPGSTGQALRIVGAVFILSRVGYFLLGVRFDAGLLTWGFQLLDTSLLKTNLLQSIFYLHSQPPLFNLFIGLVVKLLPAHPAIAFQATYLLCGLVLAGALVVLMKRLGVAHRLSILLASLFIISPTVVLYENWLFYTYPLAAALTLSVLFLHRFLATARLRDGIIFFDLLAAVVLTRSTFHLAWFLLLAAGLYLLRREQRRQILACAAVPLVLVLLLYAKNLVVFGQFAGSTWLGASLSKMTAPMPDAEREALVCEGRVSQLALLTPFATLAEFAPYAPIPAPTGIPALDRETKDDGSANYNHRAYVGIHRRYLDEARFIIRHAPRYYLRSVGKAWATWFLPTGNYTMLFGNSAHIRTLVQAEDLLGSGTLLTIPQHKLNVEGMEMAEVGLFSILLFLAGVAFGLVMALGRRPGDPAESISRLTVLVLVAIVLYVPLVSNLVEVGENNRFRFMIDPLLLVLLGMMVQRARTRFRPQLLIVLGLWPVVCVTALVLQKALPNRPLESRKAVYAATAWSRAHDAGKTRAELERAIALDPDLALARFWQAHMYGYEKKYDSARTALRVAVRLRPDFRDFRQELAWALVRAGPLDSALNEFREIARQHPFSAESHNHLGMIWLMLSQPDSAVAEFREAVRLDSFSPELRLNLAGACLRSGALRPAIESFQRAQKICPGLTMARLGMASAYDALGMPDSAALWRSPPASATSERKPPGRYKTIRVAN